MPPEIRAALSDADRAGVRRLLKEGFEARPGMGRVVAGLYDRLVGIDELGPPTERQVGPARSLVGEMNGKVVGHVLVVFRPFCFQEVRVPGAQVGMLVVDPACRRQGIGTELVHAAEALATREGAALVHLSGDPEYYGRLGFIEGYRRAECRLAVEDLDAGERPSYRTLLPDDIPGLVAMAGRDAPAGSVACTDHRFQWLLQSGHPFGLLRCQEGFLGFRAESDLRVVLVHEDAPVGYLLAAADEDTLGVYEAARCGREPLLDAAAWMARDRGCRQLALSLPATHPLICKAEGLGAGVDRGVDPRLMTRVLDVARLMRDLAPCLSRRLAASPCAGWSGTIGFEVDAYPFRLCVSEGRVAFDAGEAPEGRWRVVLPGIGLVRAVLGTEGLAELAAARLRDEPELREILRVLFPQLDPHFWMADML